MAIATTLLILRGAAWLGSFLAGSLLTRVFLWVVRRLISRYSPKPKNIRADRLRESAQGLTMRFSIFARQLSYLSRYAKRFSWAFFIMCLISQGIYIGVNAPFYLMAPHPNVSPVDHALNVIFKCLGNFYANLAILAINFILLGLLGYCLVRRYKPEALPLLTKEACADENEVAASSSPVNALSKQPVFDLLQSLEAMEKEEEKLTIEQLEQKHTWSFFRKLFRRKKLSKTELPGSSIRKLYNSIVEVICWEPKLMHQKYIIRYLTVCVSLGNEMAVFKQGYGGQKLTLFEHACEKGFYKVVVWYLHQPGVYSGSKINRSGLELGLVLALKGLARLPSTQTELFGNFERIIVQLSLYIAFSYRRPRRYFWRKRFAVSSQKEFSVLTGIMQEWFNITLQDPNQVRLSAKTAPNYLLKVTDEASLLYIERLLGSSLGKSLSRYEGFFLQTFFSVLVGLPLVGRLKAPFSWIGAEPVGEKQFTIAVKVCAELNRLAKEVVKTWGSLTIKIDQDKQLAIKQSPWRVRWIYGTLVNGKWESVLAGFYQIQAAYINQTMHNRVAFSMTGANTQRTYLDILIKAGVVLESANMLTGVVVADVCKLYLALSPACRLSRVPVFRAVIGLDASQMLGALIDVTQGAFVKQQDVGRNTPLHYIFMDGRPALYQLVRGKLQGINQTEWFRCMAVKNSSGRTPRESGFHILNQRIVNDAVRFDCLQVLMKDQFDYLPSLDWEGWLAGDVKHFPAHNLSRAGKQLLSVLANHKDWLSVWFRDQFKRKQLVEQPLLEEKRIDQKQIQMLSLGGYDYQITHRYLIPREVDCMPAVAYYAGFFGLTHVVENLTLEALELFFINYADAGCALQAMVKNGWYRLAHLILDRMCTQERRLLIEKIPLSWVLDQYNKLRDLQSVQSQKQGVGETERLLSSRFKAKQAVVLRMLDYRIDSQLTTRLFLDISQSEAMLIVNQTILSNPEYEDVLFYHFEPTVGKMSSSIMGRLIEKGWLAALHALVNPLKLRSSVWANSLNSIILPSIVKADKKFHSALISWLLSHPVWRSLTVDERLSLFDQVRGSKTYTKSADMITCFTIWELALGSNRNRFIASVPDSAMVNFKQKTLAMIPTEVRRALPMDLQENLYKAFVAGRLAFRLGDYAGARLFMEKCFLGLSKLQETFDARVKARYANRGLFARISGFFKNKQQANLSWLSLFMLPDDQGNSIWHYACQHGWIDVLRIMIEQTGKTHGKKQLLGALNAYGESPLYLALRFSRYLIFTMLMDDQVFCPKDFMKLYTMKTRSESAFSIFAKLKRVFSIRVYNADLIVFPFCFLSVFFRDQMKRLLDAALNNKRVKTVELNSTIYYFKALLPLMSVENPQDYIDKLFAYTWHKGMLRSFGLMCQLGFKRPVLVPWHNSLNRQFEITLKQLRCIRLYYLPKAVVTSALETYSLIKPKTSDRITVKQFLGCLVAICYWGDESLLKLLVNRFSYCFKKLRRLSKDVYYTCLKAMYEADFNKLTLDSYRRTMLLFFDLFGVDNALINKFESKMRFKYPYDFNSRTANDFKLYTRDAIEKMHIKHHNSTHNRRSTTSTSSASRV